MKKLESSLKNMVIVLTGVTVVAGALLGYVNELTKEPIAQAEEKAKILLDEATVQHEAAMEKNRAEIAKEKENLIEAQKQVSEFKKSLFDMYKTHLEMISAMPEIELDEEDTSQYSEQTETTEEELPQPDPFATSSFSARTIKGVYESRFTDLQFGQNNSHTGNTTTTEKEEV